MMVNQFLDSVHLWWDGLTPEVQAALVAAAIAVLAVITQIRSQGRQGREAIAESERRKIKASLYDDAVHACREVTDAAISLATKLRILSLELNVAARARAAGLVYNAPSARISTLSALYDTFSEAGLRLIILIENRRFVDPRIIVFRSAVSSVLHDARELMHVQMMQRVLPLLPVEGPNGILFDWNPPSVEATEATAGLIERMISALDDAGAYAEDFLVEMQNLLLGDLFGKTVTHRIPIDPNSQVITLERAEELEHWFAQNTAWGRWLAQSESDARERFRNE